MSKNNPCKINTIQIPNNQKIAHWLTNDGYLLAKSLISRLIHSIAEIETRVLNLPSNNIIGQPIDVKIIITVSIQILIVILYRLFHMKYNFI